MSCSVESIFADSQPGFSDQDKPFKDVRDFQGLQILKSAQTMGLYSEDFPVGTYVRIADLPTLETFVEKWIYHHPLEPLQLEFAGTESEVANVSYYHGGDVLYRLKDIPGTWHEQCLEKVEKEIQ
jgi:hypothetical protein